MKSVAQGSIGSEGNYNLDFKDGKVIVGVDYDGKLADAKLEVKVDLITAFEVAASKTDNKIDDHLVSLLKSALA